MAQKRDGKNNLIASQFSEFPRDKKVDKGTLKSVVNLVPLFSFYVCFYLFINLLFSRDLWFVLFAAFSVLFLLIVYFMDKQGKSSYLNKKDAVFFGALAFCFGALLIQSFSFAEWFYEPLSMNGNWWILMIALIPVYVLFHILFFMTKKSK